MKHLPKSAQKRQAGIALIIIVISVLIGMGVLLVAGLSLTQARLDRDKVTEEALKKAKEALIAFATTEPLTNATPSGPGLLPCPDLDDDGFAEASSCGSGTGGTDSAATQAKRLGRLPWRTLGIEDLRDGYGERLWYAVSVMYKKSTANSGLNPNSGLGTITMRDSSGNVVYDGTSSDVTNPNSGGAVALIIAPGPIITRQGAGSPQDRSCNGGSCDTTGKCTSSPLSLTAKCNPVNYLDVAIGEDNSNFADRTDIRTGNSNGFIQGPVMQSGTTLVNDKISAISYLDIMPKIQKRVAQEVLMCLKEYADPANSGRQRYPWPAPACREIARIDYWSDYSTMLFGRIPETTFNDTQSTGMSGNWTGDCNIASSSGWWLNWRFSVFYALAYGYRPGSGVPAANTCLTSGSCLQVQDANGNVAATNKRVAVIVSGHPINVPGVVQTRGGDNDANPANYLENSNTNLQRMLLGSQPPDCFSPMLPWPPLSPAPPSGACSPLPSCLSSYNRVTVAPRQNNFNDVVVTFP